MGGYNSWQTKILYSKVPEERLIAGFLTVLVRHNRHTGSTNTYDDVVQEYYDNWSSAGTSRQKAYPFNDVRPLNTSDPGRGGKILPFGDFDCFLFWVSGGMALQATIPNNGHTNPTGYFTESGTWYESITHQCQSFVRYDLISRANNHYGHNANNFIKSGDAGKKQVYIGDGNDIVTRALPSLTGSATWNPGAIRTGEEEAVDITVTGASLGDFVIPSFSIDVEDVQLTADVTSSNVVTCILANNTGGDKDLGSGTAKVLVFKEGSQEILNTGIFSDAHSSKDDPLDLHTYTNNTFFTPVRNIEIVGTHKYTQLSNPYQSGGTAFGDDPYTLIVDNVHDITFWNLEVRIELRSYDSDGTSSTSYDGADDTVSGTLYSNQGDKTQVQSIINCFFQPFGETPNLDFGVTEFT